MKFKMKLTAAQLLISIFDEINCKFYKAKLFTLGIREFQELYLLKPYLLKPIGEPYMKQFQDLILETIYETIRK